MTKTLAFAEALERAADKVEADPWRHDWCSSMSCNCGLVARELSRDIAEYAITTIHTLYGRNFCWKDLEEISSRCPITKCPITILMSILREAGMSQHEIKELEYLANPAVLNRAGIDMVCFTYFTVRENFVLYARAMASMIREQLKINELAAREIAPAAKHAGERI